MKSILKNARIAPKKANLVAGMVRGAMVEDALTFLKFTPKKGARMLYKVIHSATANAENNFKQKRAKLYIKEIVIGKAPTFKRGVPVSRGRVYPILKRNSHISVTVDVAAPKSSNSKTE